MLLKRLTLREPDSLSGLSAGSWSRRAALGPPVLWALAGCANTNQFLEEDEAVTDALTSEPMWVSYRPAWVKSESAILGWRQGGGFEQTREMISNRFLRGVVPPDAVATARAAAVQEGWDPPDAEFLQLRRAQGKGSAVLLRLFISATDGVLGININGSFG